MGTVNKLFSGRNRRSLGLEPVGSRPRVTVTLYLTLKSVSVPSPIKG